MKIYFSRGTSENYNKMIRSPDTLYFLEDSKEIYLGDDRIGFGQDITINISGTGNIISNITYDRLSKTLDIVRSNISRSDIEPVIQPILDQFHVRLQSEFLSKSDVDDELSQDSENPVKNKVIYAAIEEAKHESEAVQHDTTAGWNAQSDLISKEGTIYIYNDYKVIDGQNVAGIKIGDGKAYLIDMPFIDEFMYQHIQDVDKHVSDEERNRWNNKLNVNDAQEVEYESLVFNRD